MPLMFSDSFPIATALRASIKHYNLRILRADLLAGLLVSMVALPLAMALSIAVGLPPQYGIYTSIVAGFLCALLGGSTVQVSGPTAAFVVIVAPIVQQYGLHGLLYAQLIGGVCILLFAALKLGNLIRSIPYPVTTGFTTGIAVVIATLAFNDFLGLYIQHMPNGYIEKVSILASHISSLNIYEAVIGVATLLSVIVSRHLSTIIPSALIGLAVGTTLSLLFLDHDIMIQTISSRFSYMHEGQLHHGIPPYLPQLLLPSFNPQDLLVLPSFEEFKALLAPGATIAVLAALESLLSATLADSMTGKRHNPNAELNGIGIGNIITAFFAGIPATGALARTVANIKAGAKTPIAAIAHSGFILVMVLVAAPWIGHIPMSALAALLIVVAYHMAHIPQFIHTLKIAPIHDRMVLLTCCLTTIFIDMVAGVAIGLVLSAVLFLKHLRDVTDISTTTLSPTSETPQEVMVYKISGPLFFGNVEKLYDRYQFLHDFKSKWVVNLEEVSLVDMSGIVALKNLMMTISKDGQAVELIAAPAVLKQIKKTFKPSELSPSIAFTSIS